MEIDAPAKHRTDKVQKNQRSLTQRPLPVMANFAPTARPLRPTAEAIHSASFDSCCVVWLPMRACSVPLGGT